MKLGWTTQQKQMKWCSILLEEIDQNEMNRDGVNNQNDGNPYRSAELNKTINTCACIHQTLLVAIADLPLRTYNIFTRIYSYLGNSFF